MTPYYQDSQVTIYHGDCRDVLHRLPRSSVDLVLTDPPYGVNWQSSIRQIPLDKIVGDDDAGFVVEALRLALRCLRDNRHIYVFGLDEWAGLPVGGTTELVWDKGQVGPGNLSSPWGPSHEKIGFAMYSANKSGRARGDGRLAARLRKGSVLRVSRLNGKEVADHPTEKPVLLLRQLIESSSLIGETVLDPFIGVGSTAEAARVEGRKCIGIEIEEQYCEVAASRLSQQSLGLDR